MAATGVKITHYRDEGDNNKLIGFVIKKGASEKFYKADGTDAGNLTGITTGATKEKHFSFDVDKDVVSKVVAKAFDDGWFGPADAAAQDAALMNQKIVDDFGDSPDNGLLAIEYNARAKNEAQKVETLDSTKKHTTNVVWAVGFGAAGVGMREMAKGVKSNIGKTILNVAGSVFIGIGGLLGLTEAGSLTKLVSNTPFVKNVIDKAGEALGNAAGAAGDALVRVTGSENARVSSLAGKNFSPA